MRSYRDAILETIRLTLLDMREGQPVEDPITYGASVVTRAETLTPAKTKRFMLNVAPGDEVKTKDLHFTHCFLPVIVDFAFTMNTGDPTPQEVVEVLLADIQRWIYKDRTLNGLCLDVREEGNSTALSSENDKSVEGSLFLNVFYRHDLDDPRRYMGEGPTEPAPTIGEAQ